MTHALPQGYARESFLSSACACLGNNVGAAVTLWHHKCPPSVKRLWPLMLVVPLMLLRWIARRRCCRFLAAGCQSIVTCALAIIRGVQEPSWPVQRRDHHPDSKCPTRGITNIGNSCYFASGLQLMFRTYGDRWIELASSNPSCDLLQHISELVGHVRGGASVSSGSKVDLILSAVCDLNGGARTRFSGGRQADSSSAMTHLLSLIEVAQMGRNGDHYFSDCVTGDDESAEEHWTRFCNVHTTEFAQAQCGQTSEDVLCVCCGARGRESTVFRGFSALAINASADELRNVQHAVDQWANSACKDEHSTCSNCKAVGQWRKARCISRFPSTGVLLVTVNREYHDDRGIARKHVGGVDLPKEVKFPGGNEGEGTFRVKPVAACIHSGTVTGGHYYCVIADARGEAEGCVIANDDHIYSSAKDISALAGQGSLFAFERVPPVLRVDATTATLPSQEDH